MLHTSKKTKKNTLFLAGVFLLPTLTHAQTFRDFARAVVNVLNLVAELIMGFALLVFIVGAIRFIATAGDEKSRAAGKQLMVWGTVSLFVMIAVWGIVAVISKTFFG